MHRRYIIKAPMPIDNSGETKWVNLGMATTQPDGKIMGRFLALPVGQWDGVVVLFPAKKKEGDDDIPMDY